MSTGAALQAGCSGGAGLTGCAQEEQHEPDIQSELDTPRRLSTEDVEVYKGGSWREKVQKYEFRTSFPHQKEIRLGLFKRQDAQPPARNTDAMQLLVNSYWADTTYFWSSYSRADIASAAELMRSHQVDVHRAVVAARKKRGLGKWFGVQFRNGAWTGALDIRQPKSNDSKEVQRMKVHWSPQASAEAAARDVDCGNLAVRGVGCTTNFPAGAYTQEELEEAGEYAISKGVNAARIRANLEEIQQVCRHACNGQHTDANHV
jgi:hypothetical protein